jgi:CHAD domain-containing protein
MAKPTKIGGVGADSTLRDAAPRILRARLADVRRYEDDLAEALAGDPVHDMRVACRRLATALRFFDEVKLARPVKSLQDALGALRELHVQIDWLGDSPAAVERQSLVPAREEAVREALVLWKPAADHLAAAALFSGGRGRRLGDKQSRKEVLRRLRSVARGLSALGDPPDAQAAHAVRIRSKKLRYLGELLEPAFPRAAPALLERLVSLQETLGDLHDADVHLELFAGQAELAARALEERGRHAQRVLELRRVWLDEDVEATLTSHF